MWIKKDPLNMTQSKNNEKYKALRNAWKMPRLCSENKHSVFDFRLEGALSVLQTPF